MKPINIAVLFGGCSPEYGVSLESAYAVITHMDRNKYRPVLIGIAPDGRWFYYTGSPERIPADTWQEADCVPAAVPPGREEKSLLVFREEGIERIPLDAAFPVLHGQNGEDGTVQGVFELAGVPIVGCGVLSSALCMDKARAHRLVREAGVEVPAGVVLARGMEAEAAGAAQALGYPLFVKPVRAGSSYGISRVSGPDELEAALTLAFRYDSQVLLEEAIPGCEIGCAVMGNRRLFIGELDEIELSGGFFDFWAKYEAPSIHVPARISPEKTAEIKETAQKIYRVLDCRGFARVDIFLEPGGRIVFNEVNTIPGFTAHSRYPSMMKAAGMSFDQTVSALIELAVEDAP